jgi:hypothetical protein
MFCFSRKNVIFDIILSLFFFLIYVCVLFCLGVSSLFVLFIVFFSFSHTLSRSFADRLTFGAVTPVFFPSSALPSTTSRCQYHYMQIENIKQNFLHLLSPATIIYRVTTSSKHLLITRWTLQIHWNL